MDTTISNAITLPDPQTDRFWTVRVVLNGDSYGLDDCLTNDKSEALVEFYDAEQDGFGPRGQFVSRYFLSTLQHHEGVHGGRGLCLDGGIPAWSIGGALFDVALSFARRIVRDSK